MRVVLIAGPTGSGKSRLALRIASEEDGIIVNADALQVYAELRILTARPSIADEALAEHRLYGIRPAAHAFSVGQWLDAIAPILRDNAQAGRTSIVVGGTGLYFQALEHGLSAVPAIPPAIRERWRLLEQSGAPALHDMLAARDPRTAAQLRPSDLQRLVRALEVLDATGRPLSEWQQSRATSPLPVGVPVARYVLLPDRDELYRRVEARFVEMIAQGAIEEVRALAEQCLPQRLPALQAVGVRELRGVLAGTIDLPDAIAMAQQRTRNYIKRQLTWIRRNMSDWNGVIQQ